MRDERNYVKTYRPFIVWLLLFCIMEFLIAYLMNDGKISLLATCYGLIALFVLVHQGEFVYWINGGPDFETARLAGSERRKKYASYHLQRFLVAGAILTIYLIFSMIVHLLFWIDFLIFIIVIVATTFATVPIEF